MPRVLIVTEPPVAPETFRLALLGIGYNVVDEIEDAQRLVKRAIAIEPDVIIVGTESPSKNLFAAASALDEHAPYPLLVFTPDADHNKIEQATASGVHSYIVDGFSARRLPAIIAVAQARFKLVRGLKDDLKNISAKLEERKLIDRAKGILMHSKQMSEDQAYSAMRKLAMEKKQKLGAVAEQIITAARLLA
jgi:response regulator NasT